MSYDSKKKHEILKESHEIEQILRKVKIERKSIDPDRILVIADFDRTLSRYRTSDGRMGASSHGVLENFAKLGEEYVRSANALKEKYLPLEYSTTLSFEEKTKVCEEWWSKAHALLLNYGLCRGDVERAVEADTLVELREGTTDLFRTLTESNIPLLIFSAGLGDVIEAFLRRKVFSKMERKGTPAAFRGIPSNVHVVSNFMTFDGSDDRAKLTGFASHVIHSCNKGTVPLKAAAELNDAIRGRDVVVLLGDSVGDVRMADSLVRARKVSKIVRIGFLNKNVRENMKTYEEIYDAVIVDDGSMGVPLKCIKEMVRSKVPEE